VEISPLAIEIINHLHANGHQAYLVGGCVRDRLLGIPPKDYDIATDARPEQILTHFPRAQRVGAHFGVILVHNARGEQVEVATFRSDRSYSDGRRPDRVEFEGDPRQDALRRDFTINSLFEDPVSGEVLDFTGGQADLSHRTIRAIGDPKRRFEEDHLRLLRAVRFAARLGFAIDPETMLVIRELAPTVRTVSPERTKSELIRILTEGFPRRGLELLDESGLLIEILPEVKRLQGVEQPPEYHPEGDVWIHTLMMLDSLRQPSATLAMGVLLHDIGKPDTFRIAGRIRFDGHVEAGLEIAEAILGRLRFSREECDQILALVANHMRFKDVHQMRESTLKRFLRLPRFDEHLELNRVDCLCSNGHLETWTFMQAKHESLGGDEIRPARLLTGGDLIAEGYSPGPAFGKAMEEIETAQLEGIVTTREQALALARQVLTGDSQP
jgi:putative nucleotidyltransferase with HDIG domain